MFAGLIQQERNKKMEKKNKEQLIGMIADLERELETVRAANAILDSDLCKARAELDAAKKDQKHPRKDTIIAVLRELIKLSCDDHCPHHGRIDACKNCTIHVRLEELKEEY